MLSVTKIPASARPPLKLLSSKSVRLPEYFNLDGAGAESDVIEASFARSKDILS